MSSSTQIVEALQESTTSVRYISWNDCSTSPFERTGRWCSLPTQVRLLRRSAQVAIQERGLPIPTLWSPQRQEGDTKIIGPAYTVQCALNKDPAPTAPSHYIDSIPEGAVVFISCPSNIPNAVYGGLMSIRAKASGAVGTVVDGRIRDLQEHRDLGYPVFARDIGTAAPYELVKVISINTPFKLQSPHQDMIVHPGDYIIGDLNGVVVIPKELADEVIRLIRPLVEADARMATRMKKGMSFTEASKMFRTN